MFGLSNEVIRQIKEVFSRFPQIEKAIIYGSRAMENYKNGSDIDLTLVGKEINLDTFYKIQIELDNLLIPYKIDLSIFHQIENTELIQHIHRVGKIFYEKDQK
ncbi:MAG TPA: nucleotidyltransferase domain-containing protein [Bacteroidia bacterium]|nr:nucleotidyltransferase domain-containing protein [Bacteroidia bacterium]